MYLTILNYSDTKVTIYSGFPEMSSADVEEFMQDKMGINLDEVHYMLSDDELFTIRTVDFTEDFPELVQQPELKTVKEWFDTIEDTEVRLKAYLNTPTEKFLISESSLEAALRAAFIWYYTPEGWKYWKGVCDKLK